MNSKLIINTTALLIADPISKDIGSIKIKK